jgi:hypothetical protein
MEGGAGEKGGREGNGGRGFGGRRGSRLRRALRFRPALGLACEDSGMTAAGGLRLVLPKMLGSGPTLAQRSGPNHGKYTSYIYIYKDGKYKCNAVS